MTATARFLPRADFDRLLEALAADGRKVVGPTVADGAIVTAEVRRATDLPGGWTARQGPGTYRLEPSGRDRLFDFAVGPTSPKRETFPPHLPLLTASREDGGATFEPIEAEPERLAFVGLRACEIAALLVQDRVFEQGPVADPDYAARRAASFIVAVECAVPASTCFCTSMGTGPEVTEGYDLALSELDDGFVVRTGSAAGERLLETLALPEAGATQTDAAAASVARTRERIGDPLPIADLPARLKAAPEHPRWDEVATRCLACANCTLVCPTCFCVGVSQVSDLGGSETIVERHWDSCFNPAYARVAGGNFRPRVRDRYRQWLTHKFGTWWDQFGTTGCVGCGRCIAWCPVGIDVREELLAIAPPIAIDAAAETAIDGRVAFAPLPERRLPVLPTSPGLTAIDAVARVVARRTETGDTATIRLETDHAELLAGRPGQFAMVSLPGFPSPPISISRFHPDGLELTVRAAGPASKAIGDLAIGETVGLRGPLGRPWPLAAAAGRDVIVVAGGIGLAPLRPVLDAILSERDRYGDARLYYGARTPDDRLFTGELAALEASPHIDAGQTVDRAGPGWPGRVGVVTTLFDRAPWDGREAVAFVCGPERMMAATVDVLRARGLDPERIFVTLERRMECGVGLCGHCQLGEFFVCRDGPVFSLAELGDAFEREGL